MGYSSDPTAAKGLSGINREFGRLEKRAKKLKKLWKEGKISDEQLDAAHAEFTGIYRHVLALTKQDWDKKKQQAAQDHVA
jgi:hypothetical protein